MNIRVKQGDGRSIKADAIVCFCWHEETPSQLEKLLTSFPEAALIAQDAGFVGKLKQTAATYLKEGPAKQLVCVGLGKREDFRLDNLRKAAAAAARYAIGYQYQSLAVLTPDIDGIGREAIAQAIVEGVWLGKYKFDRYLSSEENKAHQKLQTLYLLHPERQALRALRKGVNFGSIAAEATVIARDLANTPNNDMYPEKLAQAVRKIFRQLPVKVTVFTKKKIQQLNMQGLLAVNKGSVRPPVFIVLEYKGSKGAKKPIVLVGKGITFDTGGISLKPSQNMALMRLDMHGAASVVGTIYAAAKAKLPHSIVGLIPATENMPSGSATVPGDVIVYNNGLSVEIDNTDAEGRLILADALLYAKRYKPQVVIDLATLTGACIVALGYVAAGMMGTADQVKEQLKEAAEYTGEYVWELPLFQEYDEQLKSTVADIKNVGGRAAGASVAGAFLKRFVGDDYPWVHLDIAGTAIHERQGDYTPAGGTGYGVRLLFQWLQQWKP